MLRATLRRFLLLVLVLLPGTAAAQAPPPFVIKWGSGGSGAGQFSSPYAVAVSSTGNVYVADAFNNRIQVFDECGNYLFEWGSAGSGNGQFTAPTGIAVDGSGNVFVTESSDRVQKFTSGGTYVTKWGSSGSGNGQFSLPRGITVDGNGDVYVVEQSNQRVQKFTNAGAFITKWGSSGSGNGQFSNPWGIDADAGNNVYVSETNNNRVQKFTSAGVFVTKWGTAGSGNGQFNNPRGVEVDGSGNVFVTDLNNRVQEFSGTGVFLTSWGSLGSGNGQFNQPQDVAERAGCIFVADTSNQRIQRFCAAPPTYVFKWGSAGGANGQFASPYGVTIGPNQNVYVADSFNHRIQVFDLDGNYLFGWGSFGTGDGQFNAPTGIATDAAGNVFVGESGDRVQKFTSTGTFITKWGSTGSGDGQFGLPRGVTVDGNGDVYVVEQFNSRVQKFTNNGSFLLKWGTGGSGDGQFTNAWGIDADASNNIYVSETSNNRVQKFSSTGTFITKWGTPGSGNGQFNNPRGVDIDDQGYVYVIDLNNRVQEFSNTGVYVTSWGTGGSGNGQFNQPQDLSVNTAGTVYTADTNNHRIQVFNPFCFPTICTSNIVRVVGSAGTQNVGQRVQFGLSPSAPAGSTLQWSVDGNVLKDYSELVANGPWSTTPMAAGDFQGSTLTFYWKPDPSQIHPLNNGPVTRTVSVVITLASGKKCIKTHYITVARDNTSTALQPQDIYLANHTSPGPGVNGEHTNWHCTFDGGSCGTRPANFGDLFLMFHRAFLSRFDSWRQTFGYPPIQSWDPATAIPTDQEIQPGSGVTRGSSYTPQVRPTWFTSAGGAVGRPATSIPCQNPGGQKKLSDFTTRNQLGCALVSPYHNGVHMAVGGSMGFVNTAPKDGLFWRWHKYLDTIHQAYLDGTGPPHMVDMFPHPIFQLRTSSPPFVSVTFGDTVSGVTAADVLVNGSAATNVTGSGEGPYTFTGYAPAGSGPMTVEILSGAIVSENNVAYGGDLWNYDVLDPAGDDDGDGLSNGDEIDIYHTDPENTDTDGDGLSDYNEVQNGSDPIDPNDPVSGVGGEHKMGNEVTTLLAYPNPFLGQLSIHLSLAQEGRVLLQVFDISGRLTRTLVDQDVHSMHAVYAWDGMDSQNAPAPGGIYFVRAVTPGAVRVQRIVRIP